MDLLHTRYASPFSLLDNLIMNEQFNMFVEQLANKVAEEKNEKMLWDFYLHKVHDKSFADWKKELNSGSSEGDVMLEAEKEAIMAKSQDILNGFTNCM